MGVVMRMSEFFLDPPLSLTMKVNREMYTASHNLLRSSMLLYSHEEFGFLNAREIVRNCSECQLLINNLLTISRKCQKYKLYLYS